MARKKKDVKGTPNPPRRSQRGAGYTRAEIDSMLDLVEEHLPISAEEWEVVARKHRENFPDLNRARESMKRKFSMIALRKAPTGDPDIPSYVRRAKTIKSSIEERAGGSDGGGDDFSSESNSSAPAGRLKAYEKEKGRLGECRDRNLLRKRNLKS